MTTLVNRLSPELALRDIRKNLGGTKHSLKVVVPHPDNFSYHRTAVEMLKGLRELNVLFDTVIQPEEFPDIIFAAPGDIFEQSAKVGSDTVLFTTHESSNIDRTWANVINKARAVVVTSHASANAFLASGVGRRIYVCPLGYPEHFDRLKSKRVGNFSFGTIVSHDTGKYREGLTETLAAFLSVFPQRDYPNVLLKVKGYKLESDQIDERIQVETKFLPQKDFEEWLQGIDVGVFPSRGDGFSIPPLELMALGAMIVATPVGALSEYIPWDNNYQVDGVYTAASGYYAGSSWFIPSVKSLSQKMSEAYTDWLDCERWPYRQIAQRKAVRDLTWRNAAVRFRQILQDEGVLEE